MSVGIRGAFAARIIAEDRKRPIDVGPPAWRRLRLPDRPVWGSRSFVVRRLPGQGSSPDAAGLDGRRVS